MRSEKERMNPFILVSCYGCHGLTLTELIFKKLSHLGGAGKRKIGGREEQDTVKERLGWDKTVRPRGRAQLEDNVRTQD